MKLFFMLFMLGFASSRVVMSQVSTTPDEFDWLIAEWRAPMGKGVYVEKWARTADGFLENDCYILKSSDTIPAERARIQTVGRYSVYIAMPGNQPPTLFTLISKEHASFMFENKEHDFPKRIIYSKIDDRHFTVRIEGDGKEKPAEFKFEKVR